MARSNLNLAFASLLENEALREALTKIGGEALVAQMAAPIEAEPVATAVLSGPNALLAATRFSYSVGDLTAPDPMVTALQDASAAVLVDGRTQLRLGDEGRGPILDAAMGTPELEAILEQTSAADRATLLGDAASTDEMISAWLRTFLRGTTIALRNQSVKRLSAAFTARTALAGMAKLRTSVPGAAEMKRQLDFAELVEPLRIIVGLGDPADMLRKDRFAGRDNELRRLRSFVDELDSQGVLESLTRVTKRVGRALEGTFGGAQSRMLMLSAPGGLGKSTLIAKFFLDHALGSSSFPFAYLDFDRGTIQPRSPEQLLIETARQVAILYPELSGPVGLLRSELRRGLAEKGASSLPELCGRFREILQQAIAQSRAGSFLLVLDTVEVIQSDPAAVAGVRAFLINLAGDGFPELAVVVSGRREVDEFEIPSLWSMERLRLEALLPRDATQMVTLLGESLLSNWPFAWSTKIVGPASAPAIRREPLTLRVAVEIVRQAEASERDGLVDEIAKEGLAADSSFVGKLYEKRVLDHVSDPNARKLAWPGLVVRRLTRDIVARVLAPLCELAPDEAMLAFDRLGQEVWIVERDGDALRHRPDLRARTLPLMRLHKRELFDRLVSATIAYFEGEGATTTDAAIELVYYRLLRGDDPARIDIAWSADMESELRLALDDFEPDSPAALFLSARLSPLLLTNETMKKLTDQSAWEHLARVGSSLRGLDDSSLDDRVLGLARRPAPEVTLSPAAAAARQSLLIKAGAWDRIGRTVLPESHVDLIPEAMFSSLMVAAGRLPLEDWRTKEREAVFYSRRSAEAWPIMAYALLPALMMDRRLYDHLDGRIAEMVGGTAGRRAPIGAIRAAMALGSSCLPMVVEAYVERLRSQMQLKPARGRASTAAMSRIELECLVSDEFPDRPLKEELYGLVRPRSLPAVVTDPEIVGCATELLAQVAPVAFGPVESTGIRAFARARLEGWATPVGYVMAHEDALGRWQRAFLDAGNSAGLRPSDELEIARMAELGGDVHGYDRLARAASRESFNRLQRITEPITAWYYLSGRLAATLGWASNGNSTA